MPATILLVDDEPQITHVVSRRLEKEGYRTLVACDGEEGLELALEHDVDLVVSDLQMPYMSGIEMALAMREESSLTRIPIILLTARGYVMDREQEGRARISEVMPKPFSATVLVDRIRQLLDQGGTLRDAA
ncbi:MAG: response regulator [Phycisphaerales bacterium JB040]